MDLFLNSDVGVALVTTLFGALVPFLAAVLVKAFSYLKVLITSRLNDEIRVFAIDAVRWVEQQAITQKFMIKGRAKAQEAAIYLSDQLYDRYGIRISEDKLEKAVEVALRTIKDEFGEQWANKEKAEESGPAGAEVTD